MRILLLAASALALSVGTSSLAQGNGGGGGGGGGKPERAHQGGGGKPERAHQGGARGDGQQAERGNRGQGGGGGDRAGRGNGHQRQMERAQRGPDREMRGREREMVQDRGREERRIERADRRDERQFDRQVRTEERGERRLNRRAVRVEDSRDLARLTWDQDRSIGRGCPPGLAKKNNGCMPPGQAKQMADGQNWYRNWWSAPQSQSYQYNDGYLVRTNNGGSVEQFIPLLGGALWPGQTWPDQFQASPVADYHLDYFGLQDNQDYRFADGAIYGVDPTNDLI